MRDSRCVNAAAARNDLRDVIQRHRSRQSAIHSYGQYALRDGGIPTPGAHFLQCDISSPTLYSVIARIRPIIRVVSPDAVVAAATLI